MRRADPKYVHEHGGLVHSSDHTIPAGDEPTAGPEFQYDDEDQAEKSVHAGGLAHASHHTIPPEGASAGKGRKGKKFESEG